MLDQDYRRALYVQDLSVNFDGFKAINGLSFVVEKNDLRCIIGPNGAGKTTLMDIITGKTKPDTGEVFFKDNINLLDKSEDEIAAIGVGRKFQKPTVFENLSVFENLELAAKSNKKVFFKLFQTTSSETLGKIEETLKTINLEKHVLDVAGKLSHGQKQWLEIGMLLVQSADLLLIDEPAAGMTHQEINKTAELLLSLKSKHTVVVVEHDMEFIRSLNSKVTVLHQGSVLAEGAMEGIQNNPKVVEVYLG